MKLTLQNFQRWKRLELDLTDLTSITGPSDAGKSSVIRALRWLATNRPSGTSMIRKGASFCQVTLEIDDHTIIRHRGKEGNYYLLDGKKFNFDSAKRTDPPQEILDLLNLDPLLNFQTQHASSFWLSLSAGQVSKELNQIVALDLIDTTQTSITREVKRAKLEAELCESRLEKARTERDSLAWVPDAEKAFEQIISIQESMAGKQAQKARLEGLLEKVSLLRSRKERLLEALMEARKVLSFWEGLEEVRERAEKLESLLGKAEKLRKVQCQKVERLEEVRQELQSLIGKRCPLCGTPQSSQFTAPICT